MIAYGNGAKTLNSGTGVIVTLILDSICNGWSLEVHEERKCKIKGHCMIKILQDMGTFWDQWIVWFDGRFGVCSLGVPYSVVFQLSCESSVGIVLYGQLHSVIAVCDLLVFRATVGTLLEPLMLSWMYHFVLSKYWNLHDCSSWWPTDECCEDISLLGFGAKISVNREWMW